MKLFLAALVALSWFSASAQSSASVKSDKLTLSTLRSWLEAGHAFEANDRLIHQQMQQQKASLPPWWPDAVWTEEEEAEKKVDFSVPALLFYQECFTESEARVVIKLGRTRSGQMITHAAAGTHERAALQGSKPMDAQAAGENAAAQKASDLSEHPIEDIGSTLTPQERALAETFTPAKVAAIRKCTDSAYAQMAAVVGEEQQAAVQAVVDADRETLVEAREDWEKTHPSKTP